MVAGGNIYDDTLECNRISVDQAIKDGVYEGVDMKPYSAELESIFPDGVCLVGDEPNEYVHALLDSLKDKSVYQ